MRAAREQLLGTQAAAKAMSQPLYNPMLSTGFETKKLEDSYQLGVEQTVDWWDIRGAKQHQALGMNREADAQYRQQFLEMTTAALSALAEWQMANKAAIVAKKQKKQLDLLLGQVEKRQQVGDLGAADAELTFLSLSQRLTELAEIEAALLQAESKVQELLTEWAPELGGIPDDFLGTMSDSISEQDTMQHPIVAAAKARWQSLENEIEITRRSVMAEPTFGITLGRNILSEGENESVVGVTLSIPLNIRTDPNFEIRTSQQAALEAEARFKAASRKLEFDFQAALASWQRYKNQYERWQKVVQSRLESSSQMLEQQWRNGELSTTDYLQALSQRSESRLAGITLEKQVILSLIDVLSKMGRLPIKMTRVEGVE
uniref:Putative cation efflux system protein czcC n=1 Tax=Magnetococcus massalia (strain MO-1) TaxID=451514 RepID=A0A1S7LJW1_MAGMO|nr:putative cation efflux system protein czcC [Candidatus Magnetococcus massalia]